MRGRLVAVLGTALLAAAGLAPAAPARVLAAESVLTPGQSGFVPSSGINPHLNDQIALFESFAFKPATFGLPGTETVSRAGVRIVRDAYGVPAVTAATERDAWFGVGYALAQDRLVQHELFRRGARGTLAEILGRDYLQADVVARRDYYTDGELRRMLRAMPRALRARFDAYADGVNAYLAHLAAAPAEVPAEIALLGLELAPWTALDSARVGVQLARITSSGDGEELRNARALRALGARRFDALLPVRTPDRDTTIPASEGRFPSRPGRTRAQERAAFAASRRFLRGLALPAREPAAAPAAGPSLRGSNAWAIRAPGRRAYLFSGPQLGFAVPPELVELEVHAPGLDVRGVTVAGLPVVGIGRNAHLAWASTSSYADDDDLYVERLTARERYRYKGRVRRMDCRSETFRVAGARTHRERLCRTVHGPVQARAGARAAFARRYAIWGREIDTLAGLAGLERAATVRAAERAIGRLTWTETVTVADDRGTIGFWLPGLLPLRPAGWDERLPFPGTGEAEWRGFLRRSQRPHVVNPRQGWLANWNNAPAAGWTAGDVPAKEQAVRHLHRGAYLQELVARAHAARSPEASRDVSRVAGQTAQQRPLLAAVFERTRGMATGAAKVVLDTAAAWDGDYDRADAAGTIEPGAAAWEALVDAITARLLSPREADWLGGPGGAHLWDFGGAQATAVRLSEPADWIAAARAAAVALRTRFGSADPAAWRMPRTLYDVGVLGLAEKPRLEFFDRGTWQHHVVLGP
jgi:acyl-homoserine lactone acylase PvdQ